jgi:glycosyltransferase involved in cell wall biosynthesis
MRTLSQFDHVVCISEQARQDLLLFWREQDLDAPETSVIYWPIDFDPVDDTAVAWSAKPKILCVSTLEPRKNHHIFFKAVDALWQQGEEFELTLVGQARGQLSKLIIERIEKFKAEGRPITWLHDADNKQLRQLYQECTFTVFPSLEEGYGLPILESVWFRKPCICGNNGALGEVSKYGGCYHVDQKNIDSLKEGIRLLIKNRERCEELVEQTRHITFSSWHDYLKQLVPLLRPKTAHETPSS